MYSAAVNAHIRELIEQVMEYRDQGQWGKLEQLFTETPYIDESVFNKEAPGKKAASSVLYGWRRMIRDLYYSARHKLGHMDIERTGKKEVAAISEIEARYYTLKDGERYVHKMNGTYEYNFRKVAGRWKIDSLKLKVKKESFEPIGA
jgi:SnoaL-like domain